LYIDRSTSASSASEGFPFYTDHIPEELLPGNVWVCCDIDKVPMVADARDRRAKSSDSSTWRSYEAAEEAYEARWHAGIGRVIVAREGLVGVDLDDCRSPETGALTPRASEILEALASYSEVSPSGAGVKVWVRADLARSYVKPGVEVYSRGRYFTVTGQILTQYSGGVEERTEELRGVLAQEFPRQKRRRRSVEAPRVPIIGTRLDLGSFLYAAGVSDLSEVGDDAAEVKYQILCPWIDEHTTNPESGTFVGQYTNGALFFYCYHAHCRHRQWRDFRRAVDLRSRLGSFTEVNVSYGR